MALIERLMGLEQPKIPIHQYQALAAEWARGSITGQQAQDAIEAITGQALDSAGAAEVQALVNSVPVGTTALIKADRALRLKEMDDVLLLADIRIPPYDTPTAVRTRLGLPII